MNDENEENRPPLQDLNDRPTQRSSQRVGASQSQARSQGRSQPNRPQVQSWTRIGCESLIYIFSTE